MKLLKAYCIFCKTGKEKIVADNINILIDGAQAIVPTKIVKEKRQGKWEDKEKSMIPGYIFVYSKQDIRELLEDRIFNIIKLLQYEDGSYELAGADYYFAMWIYKKQGTIDTSIVICEGDSVKIVYGPLLDVVGKVTRFDKHKKKIRVEIDFFGEKRIVTLSAEDIEQLK